MSFAKMQMQRKNDQEKKTNDDSKTKNAKFAKIVNFAKIKIIMNAFSECLHTISDARIEKNENFDDEKIDSITRDDDAKNKNKTQFSNFCVQLLIQNSKKLIILIKMT